MKTITEIMNVVQRTVIYKSQNTIIETRNAGLCVIPYTGQKVFFVLKA